MKVRIKNVTLVRRLDGAMLDHALRVRHMTRQELADEIGVSRRAVQSWVKGAVPRGDKLERVCDILNLSVTEMIIIKYRIVIHK